MPLIIRDAEIGSLVKLQIKDVAAVLQEIDLQVPVQLTGKAILMQDKSAIFLRKDLLWEEAYSLGALPQLHFLHRILPSAALHNSSTNPSIPAKQQSRAIQALNRNPLALLTGFIMAPVWQASRMGKKSDLPAPNF